MSKLLSGKKKIVSWLKKHRVQEFTLVEDETYGFVVNVAQDVVLFGKDIKNLGVKFNSIEGDFICSSCDLLTLVGSPEVVNGDFLCYGNFLKDLKGGPSIVHGSYYCDKNYIVSLEGAPQFVKELFDCSNNELSVLSLQHLPKNNDVLIDLTDNPKLGEFQKIKELDKLKVIIEKDNLDSIVAISIENNVKVNLLKI